MRSNPSSLQIEPANSLQQSFCGHLSFCREEILCPDQGCNATGTEKGMAETFGSTCHGAGRAQSRNKSRTKLSYEGVLEALKTRGVAIRVASPKLVMEEAPESYKVPHC